MTRRQNRTGYAEQIHLDLIDNDLDEMEIDLAKVENRMAEANEQLRLTVQTEVSELRKNVVGVQRILVGILVSLATSAVLFAINIGIGGRG